MYEIKLRNHFTLTNGVQLKNIGGKVVIFKKGIALVDSEEVALAARRYRYIESVTKIEETESEEVVGAPEVEETTEVNEPSEVEEAAEVEETPEVNEPTEDEETPEINTPTEEVVEEVDDTDDTPDVAALYAELGTWTAVAERLDISTSALRKLREEQGLL